MSRHLPDRNISNFVPNADNKVLTIEELELREKADEIGLTEKNFKQFLTKKEERWQSLLRMQQAKAATAAAASKRWMEKHGGRGGGRTRKIKNRKRNNKSKRMRVNKS